MESLFFKDDVRISPENSNLRGEENLPKQRKRRNNKDVEPTAEGDFSGKDKRIKEVVVFFADGTYQKFSSDLKK